MSVEIFQVIVMMNSYLYTITTNLNYNSLFKATIASETTEALEQLRPSKQLYPKEITNRCLMAMANEASYIVQVYYLTGDLYF